MSGIILIIRGTADSDSLKIKGKPLLCEKTSVGVGRAGGASRPCPPVPDVPRSPCPIMLDNCTPHCRLHPCPLDIKVQRLAGRRAQQSFELVLRESVAQLQLRGETLNALSLGQLWISRLAVEVSVCTFA